MANTSKLFHFILVILITFQYTLILAKDSKPKEEVFFFGTQGQIVYNLDAGTTSVLISGKEIISNAYAEVLNNGEILSSGNYRKRTVSHQKVEDAFGKGTKVTIRLSSNDLPEMIQVFNTYPDLDYFFVEVVLNGKELKSNYMAPLVAERVDIGKKGDNRILFVPFDNDTFIKYNAKSLEENTVNTSSEVTAFYENDSRRGLVIGSVEHSVWKTGIKTVGSENVLNSLAIWGGYTERKVTRDSIAHGFITGKSIKSPKIFVGLFDDWRDGLNLYAKANSISEPQLIFKWEDPTPFGWNSWGAMQDGLSLKKAKTVVDFFSDSIPIFRSGESAYIDLDSYWDNLVKGGLEGDFSQLKEFVKYCKSKNLKPGIYWAPFVDWIKSERRVEGSSYNYKDVWTKVNGGYHDLDGARAMDPTHPATQKRLDLLIGKFKDCGFEMIKIDFIGHAAIEADKFYDLSVTTGMQAFKKGMEYLIDKLDNKMLVYVAISPNLATAPYAHIRRIACDAYADINATEYTLNSTSYGWWQTHLYDYIDADHLVFGNELISVNRARLTSGVINGTLLLGDDFSKSGSWSLNAKKLLENEDILDIARNGEAFLPVEGNTEEHASEIFVNKIADDYYVAIINYNETKDYKLNFNRLGIKKGNYTIKELYSGQTKELNESLYMEVKVHGHDAAIFRFRNIEI